MSLPTPLDFPVTWEELGDEGLLWFRDDSHQPEPVTPLAHDFIRLVYGEGMNAAAERYGLPFRARRRCFHTWCYAAMAPAALSPTGHDPAAMRRAALDTAQDWAGEWLPEIQGRLAWWRSRDLAGASLPKLRELLAAAVVFARRMGEIHFLASAPGLLVLSEFEEGWGELCGSGAAACRLLTVPDGKNSQLRRALEDLAALARSEPAVRQALAAGSAAQVLARLAGFPAGRVFWAGLESFLAEWGRRGGNNWGIDRPSWQEDPGPVLGSLRGILEAPPAPEGTLVAADELLERLGDDPRREELASGLRLARVAAQVKEDHSFWIDFAAGHEVRLLLLELGRRLSEAGALETADDVFRLTLGELDQTVQTLEDRRELVAARRAEEDEFRTVTPPKTLGTPPAGAGPSHPLLRVMAKVFGGRPQAATADLLPGTPASPGKLRGTARVLRSPAEAGRLRPGEVLVAPTTTPSWLPLFAAAAAVVTDVGGVLSHAAVVAREFGIPAVVGTGCATSILVDGRPVEVDGDAGVVRLLRAGGDAG
ncbi:MAG: PEP-utilizing enzyme [Thermaerobacter sp.]|nr:PEP-utilizing enzyme [Thermaerobacter sp.]